MQNSGPKIVLSYANGNAAGNNTNKKVIAIETCLMVGKVVSLALKECRNPRMARSVPYVELKIMTMLETGVETRKVSHFIVVII